MIVELDLGFLPASKKNRTKIIKFGNRYSLAAGAGIKEQEALIRLIAAEALKHRQPFEDDDEIEMSVVWLVNHDRVKVSIQATGKRPKKGRYGRADATNLIAIIADALQGVLYHNDRQVAKATIEKDYSRC